MEEKYNVDLSTLFKNDDEAKKMCLIVEKEMKKVTKYKNKVMDSSSNLLSVLNLDSSIAQKLESLYVYAKVKHDINLSDKKSHGLYMMVINLYAKYGMIASFVTPEILKSDYKLIKSYILENESLNIHTNTLKEIFRLKKHVLNNETQELISYFSNSFRTPKEIMNTLLNVDLTIGDIKIGKEDIKLTITNSQKYLESSDEKIRKEVFEKNAFAFKSINETAGIIYASEVTNNVKLSDLKKHKSTLEGVLTEDNIDYSIYSNLIKSVNKNIKILHKRWKSKKTLLNKEALYLYDIFAPLIKEDNKLYTFEEARDIIMESLLIMGNDYVNVLNKAFSEKWIDAMPKDNKRSGAYATCAYNAHPYIVMNFDNTLNSVRTLTHELGHAIHYNYSKDNNEYPNYRYSLFVAEVASQVNEILLLKHLLLKSKSKNEKLFILESFLKNFSFIIGKATMYAEFEKNIYDYNEKGKVLNSDIFNTEYKKLLEKYYGNDVIIPEEAKYEWSKLPQLFTKFYTYQYATGYVAALEIAENIWNKTPGSLEKYKKFLKLGSTMNPTQSLKVAGVDIKGTKIYTKAFSNLSKLIDEFEKTWISEEINE